MHKHTRKQEMMSHYKLNIYKSEIYKESSFIFLNCKYIPQEYWCNLLTLLLEHVRQIYLERIQFHIFKIDYLILSLCLSI